MSTCQTRSAARPRRSPRGVAFPFTLLTLIALTAPASLEGQEPSRERPSFTRFTVAPRLLNVEEVQEALMRAYTREMRERRVEGTVTIWFFIDDEGRVDNTLVNQSSGHAELDEAGLRVASVYRFSPALNGDERVPVWVTLPITFRIR